MTQAAQPSTAVVLLHGLCSTPDELLSVNGPLRQIGCTVVPLQIAGYSFDADHPDAPAQRYEHWVRAVHDCVRQQRQSHQRVVLVGISAGAGLALSPPPCATTAGPSRPGTFCCRWRCTPRSVGCGSTGSNRPMGSRTNASGPGLPVNWKTAACPAPAAPPWG